MNRRMMKRAVWLVAGTLVAGMGSQVSPVAAQDGKWRMGKPMSSPQGEITSAVIGKKWYVMGGYDGPNVQARGIVTVYDASTDTWTDKKNMQIPAHHAAAVALNGKIYVFGGFVGRPGTKVWQPIPSAMLYDPETDSWKELAPMPTPRGSAQAVVVGGKIYVIGGAHANIPGKPMTEPLWAGVPQIVVGHGGGIRSRHQYLAGARADADRPQPLLRRSRRRQNLCGERAARRAVRDHERRDRSGRRV